MSMQQPLDRIQFVERQFEGYRENVEEWKEKHDELAARCWAMEDVISNANYVYRCIARQAARLKADSAREWAAEVYVRHFYLLEAWFRVSVSLEKDTLIVEREYRDIDGADELRRNIAQAHAEIHSPGPVTIDSAGHVYELTGERAIMPGLGPEQIRRGIEDADAGRTRSLKDIIAGRTGTGV